MQKHPKKNRRRILIVGSWAKEQATAENLLRSGGTDVFAYMDTENPGITSLAAGWTTGDFSDIKRITRYAQRVVPDLVLVTTAKPLSEGLVDALKEKEIPVFGPSKNAARLESDKSFARRLLLKYAIDGVPKFGIFTETEPAVKFAKKMDWRVAVKPSGLTEGLGVRVYGNQLKDRTDVSAYIRRVLNGKIGGKKEVLVEEKLEGEEFTVQSFVAGGNLVCTPAVQDFKKLLSGERGPNTAGMGAYSCAGYLLPFMRECDYAAALEIMRATVDALRRETGEDCAGFLYGQFMITASGIKLIEYNFRPGDPEWLNTLLIMKNDVADIAASLLSSGRPILSFEKKATVCKYIVPPAYPGRLNETLRVSFPPGFLRELDVSAYYSCGRGKNGGLDVGTERGIAFAASGNTISEAAERVDRAIASVKGSFHYRKDIGSKELITGKTKKVFAFARKYRKIRIGSPKERDAAEVSRFAASSPPLESYPEHIYRIMFRYFGKTCFVVRCGKTIAGFLLGVVSRTLPDTYFLWQVGVAPFMRKKGMGAKLVARAEKKAKDCGCKKIRLTIDPRNTPSRKLFERMGYSNISRRQGKTVRVCENLAVSDFYGAGRHFMLYEKIFK
ncbi:MAG: phosphoribosylamine--glycine ligase [Candidatus Omnitrophota bacterium]